LSVVVKPAGAVNADQVAPAGARTLVVELLDEQALLQAARGLGPRRWIHAGSEVRPLVELGRSLLDRSLVDPRRTTAIDDQVLTTR